MSERCPACGFLENDCARECPIARGAVSRTVYDEITSTLASRLDEMSDWRKHFEDARAARDAALLRLEGVAKAVDKAVYDHDSETHRFSREHFTALVNAFDPVVERREIK